VTIHNVIFTHGEQRSGGMTNTGAFTPQIGLVGGVPFVVAHGEAGGLELGP
jgi:hypothetical protein